MREIASVLCAAIVGSLSLESSFAIWHPSSYGRFAEFPVVLLYAIAISAIAFLVLVLPSFAWLQRKERRLSIFLGFLVGLLFGLVTMVLFLAVSRWPMDPSVFIAGGIAGAVGVSTYAGLLLKRIR
jgi:hypothetical protein